MKKNLPQGWNQKLAAGFKAWSSSCQQSMEKVPMSWTQFLNAASLVVEAKNASYSPYSKFPVGAVLKWSHSKQYHLGCNVENVSFGATICAERTALTASVVQGELQGNRTNKKKKASLDWVMVHTPTIQHTAPCGICLQSLVEFANEQTWVLMVNNRGLLKPVKLYALLGERFQHLTV